MATTKAKPNKLPNSSKSLWNISGCFRFKGTRTGALPPLRDSLGNWKMDSLEKADLLATVFANKNVLPGEILGTAPSERETPSPSMTGFLIVRRRAAASVLKLLKEDSATGPDEVPAKLLKCTGLSLRHQLSRLLALS